MNYKKFILLVVLLVFSVGIFGISISEAKAMSVKKTMTTEEIMAQIVELQNMIIKLKQQLNDNQVEEPARWCHDFNVALRYGDKGIKVQALQIALEKDGFNISSVEKKNTYFGNFTASAVVGFQEKYKGEILAKWGLKRGTGYVGSTTKAKLNKIYGCGKIPPLPIDKPHIKVLSPNGGEQWTRGISHSISWKIGSDSNSDSYVNIFFEKDGVIGRINEFGVPASQGLFRWDAVQYFIDTQQGGRTYYKTETGDKYKIKLTYTYDTKSQPVRNVEDFSDNYFSIIEAEQEKPYIKVLSPNGGEKWTTGETYKIKWKQSGLDNSKTNIELGGYKNDGTPIRQWQRIASDISINKGYYSWKIPLNIDGYFQTIPDKYKIKLTSYKDVIVLDDGIVVNGDESDNYFSIVKKKDVEDKIARISPCDSYGDVDFDGYITQYDVDKIMDIAVGKITPSEEQKKRADLDSDGKVTAADGLYALIYIDNKVNTFPACTNKETGVIIINLNNGLNTFNLPENPTGGTMTLTGDTPRYTAINMKANDSGLGFLECCSIGKQGQCRGDGAFYGKKTFNFNALKEIKSSFADDTYGCKNYDLISMLRKGENTINLKVWDGKVNGVIKVEMSSISTIAPATTTAGQPVGLDNVENKLASISGAAQGLIERIKKLMNK